MHNVYLSCLILACSVYSAFCARVTLINNAPVIVGGNVTFIAILQDYNPLLWSSGLEFYWKDSGIPTHTRIFKPSKTSGVIIDAWNVTYNLPDYPAGEYTVEVIISANTLWLVRQIIASERVFFNITDTLNGNITNIQNNKTIQNSLASTAQPVEHVVKLNDADLAYLNESGTEVVTYWFVDCVYYGPARNYSLIMNYTEPETQHNVEALVIAGYEPVTTPAPNVTTTAPPTTVKPTTSTVAPNPNVTTTTLAPKNVTKREAEPPKNGSSLIKVKVNGTLVPYNGSFPYVCLNNNTIPPDPTKTYGYFASTINVKAPVSKVVVTGDNWILHGDILNLSVKCQGSPMFSYCINFYKGQYNVTGNETCENPLQNKVSCEFYVERYFQDSMDHTIVFIISNDLNKVVYPVMVQVYKVQRQAQLSVIIVPVTFTIIAVVLIIFGVAYYVQNTNRFTVEVADFNFGQTYSDMEYMTFRERLRQSIVNAFMRAPTPSSSEGTVWPPGNNKYGSMT